MGGCNGGCGVLLPFGGLRLPVALGMLLWGCDFGLSLIFVLSWESLVLIWVDSWV